MVEAIFAAADNRKMQKAIRASLQRKDDPADVAQAVADDRQLLRELAEDLGEKRISRAEWIAARAPIEKRLAAADRDLAASGEVGPVRLLAEGGGALREAWAAMTFDERRALVAAAVERVVVNPTLVHGRHVFDPARIPDDGITWRF